MDSLLLVKAFIALTPVMLLLMLFDRLDVFNLIPMRTICALLGVGGALAALSFIANWRVLDGFPIGFSAYSRYVAPVIEEALKAAPILYLFATNRIGFKLDAAIAGFAVGGGFAAVENVWYLFMLPDANVGAWMVRGFGTAIMHGGATALFAVISHEMTERQAEASVAAYRFNPILFLPGLAVAMLLHSAFNHFPNQPVFAMAATLLLVPATLFVTFSRNDQAARQWLRTDQARHRNLLEDIRAGRFTDTSAGLALKSLARNLPEHRSAEVMQHAELKIEMVLRAEELILAAQEGGAVSVSDADRAKLKQLDAIEQQLGHALVAQLNANIGLSRNDIWELQRLRSRAIAES